MKAALMRNIGQMGFIIALLVCSMFMACDSSSDGGLVPDPSGEKEQDLDGLRVEIAQHWSEAFILPSYDKLSASAQFLASQQEKFNNDPTRSNLDMLRNTLQETWQVWQSAAIYQFGPTLENGLRATLNTYPINAEKIESNIAGQSYTLGSLSNIGAEGFPGIDYMINNTDQDVGFESLLQRSGDDRRMEYLDILVGHVVNEISKVSEQWQSSNWLTDFTSNTSSGTDVGSALGLMVNSIDLHFQRFLRDGKIAIPAGVRSAGIPRPQASEARYGGYSPALLEEALTAYVNLFEGNGINATQGPSFKRYLEEIGESSLANDLLQSLNESRNLVRAVDIPIAELVESDNQAAVDIFLAMQKFVTLFKSDMASVTGVTITNQDNDGD